MLDNKNSEIPKDEESQPASENGSTTVQVPHVLHDDYEEITIRGVILCVILAVVLGAANIYLGLLVGMTVSASIPASVISMAILRTFFKDSNILENNFVQTGASAGEALAAGVIFTLPGLIVIHNDSENPVFEGVQGWSSFMGTNYAYVTFLAMFGGLLGIAWSIPLRRALIVEIEPPLGFPEGVATAQVLKSGEEGGSAVKAVAAGGVLGGGVYLLESLGCWNPHAGFGWFYDNKYPSYFSFNVKPALLGVGYIIGPKIAGVIFLGSIVNYWIIIPVSAAINGRWDEADWNVTDEFNVANVASKEFAETRYIGVGMMLLGGVWSLITIRKAIMQSVKFGYAQFKASVSSGKDKAMSCNQKRVDKDAPMWVVLVTIILAIIPLYILFSSYSNEWGYCLVLAIFVVVVSFIFSAVAAYMAGLVGSSNNPVSGVTICSSLILSGLIIAMFGSDNPVGPPTAVMMSCAVATACAISGDNMQDLKSGYILGATPWKQEISMVIGVVSTSFVVAPILELLDSAYTLGVGLPAPQATIIASIPSGLSNGNLPWTYIGIGIGLGAVIIIIDLILESRNSSFRLPILAFAISIYLPGGYLTPIFLGATVHFLAGTNSEDQASEGILYAAGLVAGDSLMGIILAIPIVATGDEYVLRVITDPLVWPCIFPLLLLYGTMVYMAKMQPFTSKISDFDN